MNDLINRQAAITIPVLPVEHRKYQTMNLDDAYELGWLDCQKCIEELPYAQPEITLESAIDYLHSIGWMQEHDRIMAESAQPEIMKAALDAVEHLDWYHQNSKGEMVSGANSAEHQAWYKADDIYKALEDLPSAQPERARRRACD